MPDHASRRPLSSRGTSVNRLLDAAMDELREVGYPAVTIRGVARRAGVSTATAYNYFATREHLFAAVHLRAITALPSPEPGPRPLDERVGDVFQDVSRALGPEPELQEALRAALLGNEPESRGVRDEIFAAFLARFEQACGDDLEEPARQTVLLTFVGAMVLAGLGRMPFDDVRGHVETTLRLLR